MRDNEHRDKIKDWLTISILILYLSSSIVGWVNPNMGRRIILDIDELERIVELGD